MKLVGDFTSSGGQLVSYSEIITNCKATEPCFLKNGHYGNTGVRPLGTNSASLTAIKARRQEKVYYEQRKELTSLDDALTRTLEELDMFKSARDTEAAVILAAERAELRNENRELKEFLSYYGLKWTGKSMQTGNVTVQPKELDLEQVARKIEELNLTVEPFTTKAGIHQFSKEELPIGFYANGVVIKGYEFHEYTSTRGQDFINEILANYFPYEIKEEYPNGVVFKIVDHTEELYNPQECDPDFAPSSSRSKLPEKLIKNGMIIQLHEEPTNPIVITEISIEKESDIHPKEMTFIKVKSEQDSNIILIKTARTSSMAELYKCIEAHKGEEFVLKRGFPQEEYQRNDARSLRELGLHPSAVLFLHLK